MTLPLAFPVYLQQPAVAGSGAKGEHIVAMDLFVLMNLAFLLFMLGFFACWAWLIWRRTTKPEPHIKLIMEMEECAQERESEASITRGEAEPEPAPWERKPDWWKH